MKIEKYTSFVNEKLDFNDIKGKLGDSYIDLKLGLLEMIQSTLQDTKEAELSMIDLEDFISDYLTSGKEANTVNKLVEDNDLFNFYLKFQTDVDELLNETKYMDESPKSHNVFSLYDVVIDGTKQAVVETLKKIKMELFKK